MKKIKYLILLMMFSIIVSAQEHIYIPMAVILEDKRENVAKQMEMEKEAEMLLIQKNRKPMVEEKIAINPDYKGEAFEEEVVKKDKKIKKKKVKKKKVKKDPSIERYSGLKLKGGVTLATTGTINSRTKTDDTVEPAVTTILDTDINMGYGGGVEYFRNLGFMRRVEYGVGAELYLLAWDNTEAGNATTNPGEPGLMSIPIYLTLRYVLPYDIYVGGRGGMHMVMKAGNVLEAGNGTYYGVDLGKRFKNFGLELTYTMKTATITEADVNTGYNAETATTERESVDFETSGLGVSFYYLLNF